MKLSALVPPLPVELVQSLEIHGLRTQSDLLFAGSSPTDIYHRLRLNVSLRDFTHVFARVVESAAAPAVRGDDDNARDPLCEDDGDVSSGVPALDALLGSFGAPRLLEISGPSGSGKSVRLSPPPPCSHSPL
jgi:RAD51-like protein 3